MAGDVQAMNRDVVVDSLARTIKHKLVEPAGRQVKNLDDRLNLLAEKQRETEANLKMADSVLEARIHELERTAQKSQKVIACLASAVALSLAGVVYLLVRVS